jgi:hypothetical protein
MLEKTFVTQCLRALREQGCRGGLWLPYPRTRFANAGVSDLVYVSAAIEFKAPGGKYGITPTQQAFLDKLNGAGGFGRLVDTQESLGDFLREFASRKTP